MEVKGRMPSQRGLALCLFPAAWPWWVIYSYLATRSGFQWEELPSAGSRLLGCTQAKSRLRKPRAHGREVQAWGLPGVRKRTRDKKHYYFLESWWRCHNLTGKLISFTNVLWSKFCLVANVTTRSTPHHTTSPVSSDCVYLFKTKLFTVNL